ncbi:hypothetical protein PCASD_21435 [Puccinia coronata f. sp. avenae]|uniref:LNS2/PITP domain-containing protein n=1 Tax=Puccinia coronata f. sp. avenae TaxID=200324 RepID=A0A2N5S5C0_9BASI|nr:hypothetical protein PCASD_21435 [Puccinia coronata f. sp. avenae]
MSWIGRAISSVGQYYKEINPATLSGAIDVIVVENRRQPPKEKKDHKGDSPTEDLIDLACSPWHVRFGKLSVLRPVERKVRILINGEPAPFSMKIGDTGEAFFVFETDVEDLPDDLQTSPLVSPVLKSTQTPSASAQDSTNQQELETVPDFADLGEPQLESSQARRNSSTPQKGQTDPPTALTDNKRNSTEPLPDETVHEEKPHDPKHSNQPDLTSDENSWLHTGELAPSLKRGLEGKSPKRRNESESVEKKRRESQRPRRSNTILDLSVSQTDRPDDSAPHTATSLPTADLMLDMDGYKMTHEAPNSGERNLRDLAIDPSSQEDNFNQSGSDGNRKFSEDSAISLQENLVMEFTTALLRCSETINRCYFGASGSHPELETNENVIVHVVENQQDSNGAASKMEHDCEGLIIVEYVEDKNGFRGFDRFKIQSNGTWHVFEISLFSISHDDHTSGISGQRRGFRHYNHQKFKENRLTFEDFFTLKSDTAVEGTLRKDLLDDETNFIVRYNEKFTLTWENASTALTSLGICRKSIINLSQSQLSKVVRSAPRNDTAANGSSPRFHDDSKLETNGSDRIDSGHSTHTDNSSLPPPTSYTRTWTRWWYKSDRLVPNGPNRQRLSSAASADTWSQDRPVGSPTTGGATNTKVSPDTSPPGSPRSLPGTTFGEYASDEKIGRTGDELVQKPSGSAPATNTPNDSTEKENESTTHKTYAKTLRLTSDQLKQLGLKKGVNQVTFSVRSSYSGYAVCTSRIFLWEADYKICISDIDGTITKSDALGHVFNMIGRDWTHAGVAKLYTDIARNGYKLMYLTSRAIGQANTTREYLKGINQMGFVLPEGPVIMSPDRLMTSLHREVIMRKPEVFKMACLRDIKRLFGPSRSPFYAGFGNRITDALSYRAVDVPSSRIFTIDSNGEVKMELLELTGYKSSYIHMTDLVDQMFPPVNRYPATPEYSDFNYWRSVGTDYDALSLIGVDLDELLSPQNGHPMPASPTLSARSGETSVPTSRLTFRLSSLSLGRKSSKADLPGSSTTSKSGAGSSKTSFLTGSSIKLTSTSSSFQVERESLNEADEDAGDHTTGSGSDMDERLNVPARLRSDSMPGSLPGSVEEASLLESIRRSHYESRSASSGHPGYDQTPDKRGDNSQDDAPGDEDEFPQMDFSSVPYL